MNIFGLDWLPFYPYLRNGFSGADKKAAENLRRVADKVPSAHDILIQKSDLQERKRQSITNREQYLKILNQVDEVLAKVEEELERHENGKFFYLLMFTLGSFEVAPH